MSDLDPGEAFVRQLIAAETGFDPGEALAAMSDRRPAPARQMTDKQKTIADLKAQQDMAASAERAAFAERDSNGPLHTIARGKRMQAHAAEQYFLTKYPESIVVGMGPGESAPPKPFLAREYAGAPAYVWIIGGTVVVGVVTFIVKLLLGGRRR